MAVDLEGIWAAKTRQMDEQGFTPAEREEVSRLFLANAGQRGDLPADPTARQAFIAKVRGIDVGGGPGVARSLAGAAGHGAGVAYDASLTGAIGNAATGRQRDRAYDGFFDNLRGLGQNLAGSWTEGTLEGLTAAGVGSGLALLDPAGRAVDVATLGLGGRAAARAVGALANRAPGAAVAAARATPYALGATSGAVQGGGYAVLDGDLQHAGMNAVIGAGLAGAFGLHAPAAAARAGRAAATPAAPAPAAKPGVFGEMAAASGLTPPPAAAAADPNAWPRPKAAAPLEPTHRLVGATGSRPVRVVANDGRMVTVDDGVRRTTLPANTEALVPFEPLTPPPAAPAPHPLPAETLPVEALLPRGPMARMEEIQAAIPLPTPARAAAGPAAPPPLAVKPHPAGGQILAMEGPTRVDALLDAGRLYIQGAPWRDGTAAPEPEARAAIEQLMAAARAQGLPVQRVEGAPGIPPGMLPQLPAAAAPAAPAAPRPDATAAITAAMSPPRPGYQPGPVGAARRVEPPPAPEPGPRQFAAPVPRAADLTPLPPGGAMARAAAPNLHAQRAAIAAEDVPLGGEREGLMWGESGKFTPVEAMQRILGGGDEAPAPAATPLVPTSEVAVAKRVAELEKFVRNSEKFQALAQGKQLPPGVAEDVAKQAARYRAELAELRTHLEANRAKAEAAAPAVVDAPPYDDAKFAGNINLDRVDTADDIKAVYQAMARDYAPQIEHARRGEIGQGETRRLAEEMGMTMDQLLKRRRGQAFNAEEALAARRILASSAAGLQQRAAKVRAGATDEELVDFRRALELHAQIQAQVAGATAEAGRALASFRIQAKEQKARMRAIDEMIGQLGGRDTLADIAHAIDALSDPAALNQFVRNATKPGAADKLAEYYINSILSGPPTLVGNAAGNTLVLAGKMAETMTAAGISLLTHNRNGVRAGEAKQQLFGIFQSAREALELGTKAFKTEEATGAFTNSAEVNQKAIGGELGRFVRLPSRFLTGTDVFFKTLAYRMELNALAYRMAANEGAKGDGLAARLGEILADPPDAMVDAAQQAARYHTFTQSTNGKGPFASIDALAQGLTVAKSKVPALAIFLPFIRTPANIVKYALERTPAAFLSREVRTAIAAGGAERDMALGKVAFGSMLGLFFYAAAEAGMITGGGPSDRRAKEALTEKGWQPYSVKVGDQYLSYVRTAPYGMLVGLAADLATAGDFPNARDKLGAAGEVITSAMRNFGDQTFFKGIKDLADALADPDRFAARYAGGVAGGFVPNVVNKANQAVDPTVRDTAADTFGGTVANMVKTRAPGLAQTLPAKLDDFGRPVERDMRGLEAFASPAQRRADKHDPVRDELARLGMPYANDARRLGVAGVDLELDAAERRDLTAAKGPLAERILAKVVTAPRYQALSDEQRKAILQQAMAYASTAGRARYIAEHAPAVRDKYARARAGGAGR